MNKISMDGGSFGQRARFCNAWAVERVSGGIELTLLYEDEPIACYWFHDADQSVAGLQRFMEAIRYLRIHPSLEKLDSRP